MDDNEIKRRLGYRESGLEISDNTLISVRTALRLGVSIETITDLYKNGLYDAHESPNYQPSKNHISERSLKKPQLEQVAQTSSPSTPQTPSRIHPSGRSRMTADDIYG